MSNRSDYTTRAQRYTARYPVLTYTGTQVNFWIISNALLAIVSWLVLRIAEQLFAADLPVRLGPMLIVSVTTGILYGMALGIAGYHLEQSFFKKLPLGKVIVLKSLASLGMIVLILLLTRWVMTNTSILPPLSGMKWNESVWDNLFVLLLVYYTCMTLVINFVNQVNRKYGPGVLIPLLLGRYRNPKETERIFMFMDLKSSTAIAEQLGHLRYSSFIRDCFADINAVLFKYHAQVYQYVGDEIVLMWPVEEGLQNHSCIRFYSACREQFRQRADHYHTLYGLLPHFKAGVHMGTVTAVEIGDVKRDIAYHGDTLNTAARIQSVCNVYGKDLLASESLVDKIGPHPQLKTESLGKILLRGKSTEMGIVNVIWNGPSDLN